MISIEGLAKRHGKQEVLRGVSFAVGRGEVAWLPWDAVFGLFQRVNDVLEHPRFATMTDSVQAIELDRAVTPAAVLLPSDLWPSIPTGLIGEAALAANVGRLRHLLNHLQPV